MKEAGGDNLLAAIRKVLRGEIYVSPRMAASVLDGLSARRPRGSSSPIEKLTDREFEVFRLIGQGKSTRDISELLHLSPKTVDVHRSRSEEHTSELQSLRHLVCRLLLEKKLAFLASAVRTTPHSRSSPELLSPCRSRVVGGAGETQPRWPESSRITKPCATIFF